MSLTSELRLVQFTLNVDGPTVLPSTFKFLDAVDLKVTKTVNGLDTLLVLNTDYTVSGGGVPAAIGAVTILAGLIGDVVTIEGAATETQPNDLNSGGPPSYQAITAMFDRLTMLVQQLKLQTDRCVRIPNTNDEAQIPEMALNLRKNMFIGFDANGDLVLSNGSSTGESVRTDITAFTGGTAECLDSIPVATLALNSLLKIQIGGPKQGILTVQIVTSTDAPVAGVIIRPPDYDPALLPRQWFVVG